MRYCFFIFVWFMSVLAYPQRYMNVVCGNAKSSVLLNNIDSVTFSDYACGLPFNKLPNNGDVYIVDAQGKGDFENLHEALEKTYTKDKTNSITLIVMPGEYCEPFVNGNFTPFCNSRNMSIIGFDKKNTIIKSRNSYYYPGVGDGSCLKVAGNVCISNLTFIANDDEYKEPKGTSYVNRHSSYCLHIDCAAYSGDVMEIDNCDFYNDHNCCVGIGLKKGLTIKMSNCNVYCKLTNKEERFGGAAIYVHDDKNDIGEDISENMLIDRCNIESNGIAIKMLSVYGSRIGIDLFNNYIKYEGKAYEFTKDKVIIDKWSKGNNISELNKDY